MPRTTAIQLAQARVLPCSPSFSKGLFGVGSFEASASMADTASSTSVGRSSESPESSVDIPFSSIVLTKAVEEIRERTCIDSPEKLNLR